MEERDRDLDETQCTMLQQVLMVHRMQVWPFEGEKNGSRVRLLGEKGREGERERERERQRSTESLAQVDTDK